MNIGTRIKQRRLELGMGVDELAKRLGKHYSTIYRYEKGDIENLPLDVLGPIAEALDTTPAYLMGWITEEEAKENDDLVTIVEELENNSDLLKAVLALINMPEPQRTGMVQMLLSFGTK